MAGVPKAVTITRIVISAISATNAITQTAIKINEIYGNEGKRTIDKR